MNPTALDERARTAARDARARVAPVAHAALNVNRRGLATGRTRALPVACLAALAVIAAGSVYYLVGGGERQDSTVVAGGTANSTEVPATPPLSVRPSPPGSYPGLFGESVAVEGTATDGRAWALHVGGPDNELCLSVDISSDIGTGAMTSVCQADLGRSAPPGERHRPLIGGDLRTPSFVFGRMPDGVVALEVVLEGGTRSGRQPVHRSDKGPLYAVELDPGVDPVAVVGIRADCTSVRFDVER